MLQQSRVLGSFTNIPGDCLHMCGKNVSMMWFLCCLWNVIVEANTVIVTMLITLSSMC